VKTVLEQDDLQEIAAMVASALKPLLANTGDKTTDDVFGVKELSDYLKVKRTWIYEKTHLNEIPFIKAGGKLLFRRRKIDQWLDDNSTPAITGPPERIRNTRPVD